MYATEKRNSLFNSLAQSVMNSHDANFWLQKINPLWSVNQALAKVVKKQIVAKDTVSLILQCNRHVQRGVAGQHHPITVEIAGRHYERSYSLMQLDADNLCLTVKKVDQGIVSSWLVEKSKIGDILYFGQPYGEMQQHIQTPNLLLLAAGSGITPMLSLIEGMCQSKQLMHKPVQLMYWVKTHEDAAYADYLKEVAENFSNFSYQIFYTQEQDQRLNQSHVEQFASLNEMTVYACGPSGFATTAETLFGDAASIQTEAFSLSQFDVDASDTGFINVRLTQSNKTVAIPKGQSILASLEQQGIRPNHGCRMGICNKCACSKAQGATKNLLNGSANHEPAQLLKICVNSAQSDLVIDL
ncbi:ferredoxin reductase [Acinetobacter sp. NIPH 2699]|uniref:ferredoxin reductase n=1 Tax=Acinetobacter sp. NIPH 2699 TaxID=2923433 RepID=UPI001F4A2BE9|nr:ferredoxin reductase [Acinetobacter sp. NIPH 2699]MCH7336886.1 ferredoxin reductase [Acinetobacter sp. NIPH 2699]